MSDFPFINIGKVIKFIVRNTWWGTTIFSIIWSTVLIEPPFYDPQKALLFLIFGPIIAYIVGLFLYGFGILVENAETSKKLATNNAKLNSDMDDITSNDANEIRDNSWICHLATIIVCYILAIYRFFTVLT